MLYYHTSFQEPVLSGASVVSTSQVYASAMFPWYLLSEIKSSKLDWPSLA